MGEATRILVVDDEKPLCLLLETIFTQAGYQSTSVSSGQEFWEAFDRIAPDVVVLDFTLPDTDGLKLLEQLRARTSEVPTIMLTAVDVAAPATAAMKLGAYDYLVKPPEREKLLVTVKNALHSRDQARELRRLRAEVHDLYTFEMIIGSSAKMREAKAYAQKVAASDVTVLVRGESGTGKELFARAMHYGGARSKGPFVDVNCAALTESLLESEIFGHEKGAFTGAASRHIGKFEQADGGTIFLDEIGDMPLSTQAKLLRVLQERSFQRVGGTERVSVDVRVVSASNQPLEKLASEGKFRGDLFYRINTVVVEIPPLRERMGDVMELMRHFLAVAARQEGKRVTDFSGDATRAMNVYPWPGNVRELENAVRRAVVLCDNATIEPVHLPPTLRKVSGLMPVTTPAAITGGNLIEAVEGLERGMIMSALERSGWVKARAARLLGVTERILSYKMDSYGIVREAP